MRYAFWDLDFFGAADLKPWLLLQEV